MKDVQVIDGADNCTYPIYEVTDDEFAILFPEFGQDIEFIEDVVARIGDERVAVVMRPVWQREQKKAKIKGIHGTLFYGLTNKRKYYPTKRDCEMIVVL